MTTQPDLRTARRRRGFIIAMCRRRQWPGTGSDLAALMEREPTVQWPDLTEVLRPIRYAVVGAVATRLYMPERTTNDLHVAVTTADREQAEQRLAAAGWERTGELAVGGSTWLSPDGVAVDLLECRESWAVRALEEACNNRDADGLPIIPLPYLVLLKMRASRAVDIADIMRMLGLAGEGRLAEVRTAIAAYAPDDVEDLESLIELGKLETGR